MDIYKTICFYSTKMDNIIIKKKLMSVYIIFFLLSDAERRAEV